MNYNHPYTYDNIDYIIWLICWNSTYYYHDDKEKEVHLIELITNFPRMKLNRKLKPICVSSVCTTVFSNKKSTIENFKNLSYLFHHCKDILTNAEDKLKELNKYLISAKLLDLGFEYTTKQNDIRAKFQEKKDFKIESLAGSLNDLSRSQENKEREKLIDSDNEHKSNEDNNKNKNFKLDLKEDYVSKSPDPNDYKRNINNLHLQLGSMSVREREMFEQMLSQPIIKFEKRSMEKIIIENELTLSNRRNEYQYFVFLKAKCDTCNARFKSREAKDIASRIANKSRELSVLDQITVEEEEMKRCPNSKQNSKHEFRIWLEARRKVDTLIKSGEKTEIVGNFDYYPPFTLFDKLCKYIKNEVIIPQQLRRDNECLFWNLLFRFKSDQIDYRFMLPYEKDLIENDNDTASSFGFMNDNN